MWYLPYKYKSQRVLTAAFVGVALGFCAGAITNKAVIRHHTFYNKWE
jgi:hypothetical protein